MKESDIQSDIMTMLTSHPQVVYAFVTTTGTVRGLKGGRPFKVGIPGLCDILGMLRGGQSFGIEVKKPGEEPDDDQWEFLRLCEKNGGRYGWTCNVEGAMMIVDGSLSL